MSDAKARHFKPHGRFPFVTSIWWRLNNSAREQAQGAQPPHHGSCASRRNTITCITIETPRRLRGGYSFLPFRYPFDTLTKLVPKRNLSLSYSRISHLQPSHPPFHDVPHEVRDKISSELRNRTCQTTPIPASNVQATPFSPFYPLPLRRPLQCHATSTIPPLRPAVADNRPPLSLSLSLSSSNDKLTLERGALLMSMRAIFKRRDFFETTSFYFSRFGNINIESKSINIYIYIIRGGGKKKKGRISKLSSRYFFPQARVNIALDGERCKDGLVINYNYIVYMAE